MTESGCKNCPVNPCETINYRGSTCSAQRAKYGLGDPMTNADRIRAMSDEELALVVCAIICAEDCPAIGCDCDKCFFKEPCFNGSKWHGKETEWLMQPAERG